MAEWREAGQFPGRRYRRSEDVGLKADTTKAEKGTDLSDRSRSLASLYTTYPALTRWANF